MISTEAKVGAFVVSCAIVLCATVYMVSGAQLHSKRVPYRTYLRNAEGVEPGTLVLFGGISVGKVTAVQPDRVDPTRIEISLDVNQSTPLNTESVAEIGTVSLMSSPVLAISTGSNSARRLTPGAVIRSEETVSIDELQRRLALLADTAQSTLVEARADLNDLAGGGRQLLSNLNQVTGSSNRKYLSGILRNSDSMIAGMSPQVVQLTKGANAVVAKLGPAVDNVNATVTNANGTISAMRGPTEADLLALAKAIEDARALLGSMQLLVRANSENATEMTENLRMATDNLNSLTESVKERPWSLVRIRQPKDRKVPR